MCWAVEGTSKNTIYFFFASTFGHLSTREDTDDGTGATSRKSVEDTPGMSTVSEGSGLSWWGGCGLWAVGSQAWGFGLTANGREPWAVGHG